MRTLNTTTHKETLWTGSEWSDLGASEIYSTEDPQELRYNGAPIRAHDNDRDRDCMLATRSDGSVEVRYMD